MGALFRRSTPEQQRAAAFPFSEAGQKLRLQRAAAAQDELERARRAMLDAPLTPQAALDRGFTAEATAWAIGMHLARRYGVSAACQLIATMQRAVNAFERESRDLADDARRAGL